MFSRANNVCARRWTTLLVSMLACFAAYFSLANAVSVKVQAKGCLESRAAHRCERTFPDLFQYMGQIQVRLTPSSSVANPLFNPLFSEEFFSEGVEALSEFVDSDRLFLFSSSCAATVFFSQRDERDIRIRKRHPYREPGQGWWSRKMEDIGDAVFGVDVGSTYRAIALTARHCVDNSDYQVVAFGSRDQAEMLGVFQVLSKHYVKEVKGDYNDVAILVLGNFRTTTAAREALIHADKATENTSGIDCAKILLDMFKQNQTTKIGIDFKQGSFNKLPVVGAGWGRTYMKIPEKLRKLFRGGRPADYGASPKYNTQLTKHLRCMEMYAWETSSDIITIAKETVDSDELASCGYGDSGGPLVSLDDPDIILGVLASYKWDVPAQLDQLLDNREPRTTMTYSSLVDPGICVLYVLVRFLFYLQSFHNILNCSIFFDSMMQCVSFEKHIWHEQITHSSSYENDDEPVGGYPLMKACTLIRKLSNRKLSKAPPSRLKEHIKHQQYYNELQKCTFVRG